MLKLMQPTPYLPQGHPLTKYEYAESDHWTPQEVSIFHRAIFKFDKDFAFISKEVKYNSYTCSTKSHFFFKSSRFAVGHENSEAMRTVLLFVEKSLPGRL